MNVSRSCLQLGCVLVCFCAGCEVTQKSQFESQLFKTRTLVYSDDFDGQFNRERWGAPKKDKQIKDGKLIVTSQFTSREEATKRGRRTNMPVCCGPVASKDSSRKRSRLLKC